MGGRQAESSIPVATEKRDGRVLTTPGSTRPSQIGVQVKFSQAVPPDQQREERPIPHWAKKGHSNKDRPREAEKTIRCGLPHYAQAARLPG